jgi:3-dehydroquinate dehydratase-2
MAVVSKTPEARRRTRLKPRPKLLLLHGPRPTDGALHGPSSDAAPIGSATGPDVTAVIDHRLAREGDLAAVDILTFRGEGEAALIDRVRRAPEEGVRFMVFDPAGLVHVSRPLREALSASAIPFIEVQLSNAGPHEPFEPSAAHGATAGAIVGLGAKGYELAVAYALRHVKE